MPVYHVHFVCAPDYNARRLPFRPAHLKQLASLREQARVVAGGPEPDGTDAHIFYRVRGHAELVDLLEENEFNRAGLAVVRSSDPDEAIRWLAGAGGWEADRLRARPWSQTL